MSGSLRHHGLQHARLPCLSPTPGAYSYSCLLNQWCHPTISSSVFPFSSCPQSSPASGSFPVSQLFTSGGQRIGTSASVLPMNIQDWFPWGSTVIKVIYKLYYSFFQLLSAISHLNGSIFPPQNLKLPPAHLFVFPLITKKKKVFFYPISLSPAPSFLYSDLHLLSCQGYGFPSSHV